MENLEKVKIYIDGEAVPLSKLVRLWQMHQESYKSFKKLVDGESDQRTSLDKLKYDNGR